MSLMICGRCTSSTVETKREGTKIVCQCKLCGHRWTEPYRENP